MTRQPQDKTRHKTTTRQNKTKQDKTRQSQDKPIAKKDKITTR